MTSLSQDERDIVATVREFVDREVKPVVRDLEHDNVYPEKLIDGMKQLGIFGLAIPEPYGEVKVSVPCYALCNIVVSMFRAKVDTPRRTGGRWHDRH